MTTAHEEAPIPAGRRRQRPARAHKTAMTVAQRIVEDITDSNHPPGTRLATEREMLLEYGVGRGTLRESLRLLEMNGVITLKPGPGGGPIVGEPDSRDLAGALGLFMQVHGTPFRAIVEVRKVLEPFMAGLAAQNASDEAIEQIRATVDAMNGNLDSDSTFLRLNEQFHELVAWASGNSVLALLICSLHWITDGTQLGVDYPEERRAAAAAAHVEIYEAIAKRDPEQARVAMEDHIRAFERYVQRFYPVVFSTPVRWSDITL